MSKIIRFGKSYLQNGIYQNLIFQIWLTISLTSFKLFFRQFKKIQMKQTSKQKIINQNLADKLQKARQLRLQQRYDEAIQAYHKVLFLKEDALYIQQLAQIYEKKRDISSALLFYRRTHQLSNSTVAQQKVKLFSKIQGLQLLDIGSAKNILEDSDFGPFIKRYPIFHKKMIRKADQNKIISDDLYSCLAYLEVNQRQFALNEIENCLKKSQSDADLVVLRALIYWSLMENSKGYKEFWNAYTKDKLNPQVILFIQMITPQLQKLYKEAKYDLIDKKNEKCKLKIKQGLQKHPYHTQFLILSAFLHRSKQQYEAALSDLQLANKHIENKGLQEQLRNQISLTYNQMGIFLYKQSKFNEALTLFSQGLSFKQKDWGMLANRGDCYKGLNNFIKALQDYLAAYEIQKKNEQLNFRISSIYNIRGIALFNSKNYELSLREFEESIRFSPKCAQFHLSKAKCLLQLQNKQEAVQALQKCLLFDASSPEAIKLIQQLKEPEQRNKNKNNRKVIYLSKEK